MAKYCCDNFKKKIKEGKFKADKNTAGEYAYFAKGTYLLTITEAGGFGKVEDWREMEECPYCQKKFEDEDDIIAFPKEESHRYYSHYPKDSDPSYYLRKDGLFHIGQCYDDNAADTVVCEKCKSDKFYVGEGSYFTVIKCINCKWELCIHDG